MLQHCLCAMLWSLDLKACGITVPQPGIELALPISEGEVPTIGPPRKSLSFCLCLSVSIPLGGSLPHWRWAWPDGFLWPMGLNKCNTTKDSKSVCTQEFDLSSISETFLTCAQVHVWGLISHLLEYARYMFTEWTKPSSACMLQDCDSCYFLCPLVSNSHNFFFGPFLLSKFMARMAFFRLQLLGPNLAHALPHCRHNSSRFPWPDSVSHSPMVLLLDSKRPTRTCFPNPFPHLGLCKVSLGLLFLIDSPRNTGNKSLYWICYNIASVLCFGLLTRIN